MTKEKHILLCLALLCCTSLVFGQPNTVSVLRPGPSDGSHAAYVDSVKNIVQDLIRLAEGYLDSPYKLGARGPKTFDCSGFVSFLFEQFDVQLPRTCKGQMKQGSQVDKTELRAGDLVFFQGRYTASVGHVGLVVDNSEAQGLKFIHASRRGVKEDILEDSEYYRTRYITGVRLL